jgi:trehalose synthase
LFSVPVPVGPRRLGEYASIIDGDDLASLRSLAEPLKGLRVLHLSASPFGSAVAETLSALVPLQRDLGILADWHLIRDIPRVCTRFYEGLRGDDVGWNAKERAAWARVGAGDALPGLRGYDVVIVHDPQLLGLMPTQTGSARSRWIWHCHLDTTSASPAVWEELGTTLEGYAGALFPSPRLVRSDVPVPFVGLARPALDPWSLRNIPLSDNMIGDVLNGLGIDPDRPILGQFAPIDHRFAALGALGTYWLVRRRVPGIQMVLAEVGLSDPDGRRLGLKQVVDAVAGDPDIHIATLDTQLGPTQMNALQRACTVALQMAVPRGFGWGLAECLWKERPGVVGKHGELPEQVGDAGIVVNAAPEAADAVQELLANPAEAMRLGRRGHARVAEQFLVTGLASDYAGLLHRVIGVGQGASSQLSSKQLTTVK